MEKLSRSVSQTLRIGKRLAQKFHGGEIILLSGCLGAGKTVLAKGIAQGLGINKNNISSPTFVLLRIHEGRHLLHHFDFYRIKTPGDIFALGLDEYFYSDGVTIIEWPQRLKFFLPKEFLMIKLTTKGRQQRSIKFIVRGLRYKKLLEEINEDISN
jgi:tRNA threonylcarbamoyladenosine biosynthesis protein TsaE